MFARYPSGFSRNTMIQKLFLRPFVRRRMAASHLGIILEQFALDLQTRGYAVSTVQSYVQVTEHFLQVAIILYTKISETGIKI